LGRLWTDLRQGMRDREIWAEAHPWQNRVVGWYYFVWRWTTEWREWKYLLRRTRGFFTRGYRGWADLDVWGLDHYVARVLAGSLRHLAKTCHGSPNEFYDEANVGHEGHKWRAWLNDKADWFDWYYKDEDGASDDKGWVRWDLSDEERSRRIKAHENKMEEFQTVVLPDFIKYFRNLWD
jgi:hypothetical protein